MFQKGSKSFLLQKQFAISATTAYMVLTHCGKAQAAYVPGDFPGVGSRANWSDAQTISMQAVKAYNSVDLDGAQKLIESALAKYDSDYLFHKIYANILQTKGDDINAVIQYKKSTDLYGVDAELWQNYSLSLYALGQSQDARKAALKAGFPGSGNYFKFLDSAQYYAQAIDGPRALTQIDLAIWDYPYYLPYYTQKGTLLGNVGKPSDAIAALDKGAALSCDSALSLFSHGIAYNRLKQDQKAKAMFVKALAVNKDPNFAPQIQEAIASCH